MSALLAAGTVDKIVRVGGTVLINLASSSIYDSAKSNLDPDINMQELNKTLNITNKLLSQLVGSDFLPKTEISLKNNLEEQKIGFKDIIEAAIFPDKTFELGKLFYNLSTKLPEYKSLPDDLLSNIYNDNKSEEILKSMNDIVKEGFSTTTDLLSLLVSPSNPEDAYKRAAEINDIRMSSEEENKIKANLLKEGLFNKAKYAENILLERKQNLEEHLFKNQMEFNKINQGNNGYSSQYVLRRKDELRKSNGEINKQLEDIDLQRKNIGEKLGKALETVNSQKLFTDDKWFEGSEKRNRFFDSLNNISFIPGGINRVRGFESGQQIDTPHRGILNERQGLNNKEVILNTENVNITNSTGEGVKTVTGNFGQEDISSIMASAVAGQQAVNNSFSSVFELGGVAVHVSQIAQISDELVYQVFNRVGVLLAEQAKFAAEKA